MNKQELKFIAKKMGARLTNSLVRTITAFPPDAGWDERHLIIAMRKLSENPDLTVDQAIKLIKIADQGPMRGKWIEEKSKTI